MPRRSTTSAAAASAAALLALSGPAAGAFSPSLSPPRPSSAASFLHRGAAAPLQLDGAIGADCGQADGDEGHTVTVTYEGRSALVHVEPSESILSALERTGAADALCLALGACYDFAVSDESLYPEEISWTLGYIDHGKSK